MLRHRDVLASELEMKDDRPVDCQHYDHPPEKHNTDKVHYPPPAAFRSVWASLHRTIPPPTAGTGSGLRVSDGWPAEARHCNEPEHNGGC